MIDVSVSDTVVFVLLTVDVPASLHPAPCQDERRDEMISVVNRGEVAHARGTLFCICDERHALMFVYL